MYFNLSTENKELIIIIIIKIIIHDNYHRSINITYGQKHMSKLLKVMFPILKIIRRYLFTQMLILAYFQQSF